MITGGSTVTVNGAQVCVDQDTPSCPIKDHGITPVMGTVGLMSSGKQGVKTGDVAECSAVIVTGSVDTSTNLVTSY